MTFRLDLPAIHREMPQYTKDVIRRVIQDYFDDIKSGNVISEPYAASTAKRRRRYGLPTDKVRLYGSNAYSRRSYRLLTVKNVKWKLHPKKRRVSVSWKKTPDADLWRIHRRRYSALK